MRSNFPAAIWVLAALCACKSRPLPNEATTGSAAGGPGQGTGGQGHPAGAAGAGGSVGGGMAGGIAGSVAGTTGGGGLGGADATAGGAGVGGSAGGAAGAGGTTPAVGDCPPGTAHGQACVVGSNCTRVECVACSEEYWRLARQRFACICATGVWNCPVDFGQGVDCFFDPPLGCELAQSLYEDATCQTHPPCAAGD